MRNVVIIGCGYTGLRLAVRLQQMGFRVTGTARSEQRIEAMRHAGVEIVAGELDDEATLRQLAELEPAMVAYFVPPQKDNPDPLPKILNTFRSAAIEAFIYASATSVYGDRNGEWVDESTPLVADGVADFARIQAEQLVEREAATYGSPTRICRISGIYGPGRTLKAPLQSGQYTLVTGRDSWVGRIHVDDLVTGIIAAWQRGADGQVYNVVDQCPHRASEFAKLAAALQGLKEPVWIDEDAARGRYSPAELRRKVSSKRIRCARLIDDLGVQLRFPTFREGLQASINEDRAVAS